MTKRKEQFLSEEERVEIRLKLSVTPPLCFTQEQWTSWRAAAYTAKPDNFDGYCEDCTPQYKEQMQRDGKCVWPCVEFTNDIDGMLCGKRMSIKDLSAAQLTWLKRI